MVRTVRHGLALGGLGDPVPHVELLAYAFCVHHATSGSGLAVSAGLCDPISARGAPGEVRGWEPRDFGPSRCRSRFLDPHSVARRGVHALLHALGGASPHHGAGLCQGNRIVRRRGRGYANAMAEISYRRHRFPPVIIQHAVWLYLRFTLSYRDVEELLTERGLDISYETVRCWVLKFGPMIARRLRRHRPRPSTRW